MPPSVTPSGTVMVPVGGGPYATHNYLLNVGSGFSVVQNAPSGAFPPNGILFENFDVDHLKCTCAGGFCAEDPDPNDRRTCTASNPGDGVDLSDPGFWSALRVTFQPPINPRRFQANGATTAHACCSSRRSHAV